MRQYIALIHKDAGSDYGVSFPDLPGCVTAGLDLDDARRMAEEALALHLGAWRRTTGRFQNPPRWKP
jgi:predicted RNase H-like HicB family nuclease